MFVFTAFLGGYDSVLMSNEQKSLPMFKMLEEQFMIVNDVHHKKLNKRRVGFVYFLTKSSDIIILRQSLAAGLPDFSICKQIGSIFGLFFNILVSKRSNFFAVKQNIMNFSRL